LLLVLPSLVFQLEPAGLAGSFVAAGGFTCFRPPLFITALNSNLKARQVQAPMHNTQQNNFGIDATTCPITYGRGHDSELRGDAGASSPATTFPKGWQRERIQRLARICRCLDRGRAHGKPVSRMLTKHAWRWKRRFYKADPERPIRFGFTTLRRLYYAWKSGGRTPNTLVLHYWRGQRKASMVQVIELSKLCLAAETRSFRMAYRKLARPGATEDAYRHATPARLRVALAALLAHRRHEQILKRVAEQILEEVVECS